ncbi:MAG: 23S rRNA (adenine(2503)-C(2))-methyltransferase RlmN [Candidatus Eisenbacteria bacterium]|nr:23S rRNA (adenine(2503)-C(2))-methyltransferase RlmN [Candidatus Latescibacterota bacterium]MBD3302349.1 23S rRNA (adenine(2503)-C(2))-methyltransferase RlmN [Candidatus Eisenbacteria bacterium]
MTRETDAAADCYGLSPRQIATLPVLEGESAYRGRQIARWIYEAGARRFEEMTDLSKEIRARLESACVIGRLDPESEETAADDGATKYLFRLRDGRTVEAVWIRDEGRDTLCVSSQAGCAYGCTFCATAAMRAGRDLTPGEILSQVAFLRDAIARRGGSEAHNLVFMGMGEPLANYDGVVGALRILVSRPGFGLAHRRITVSTVGLEPGIRRLTREPLGVRLAFSLNATTDTVRSELMPINRKYPFRRVFEALREYQERKRAPVTLEYVLLRGINDRVEDAERLARFARSLQCKVNLIAYNPHAFARYEPVPDPEIEAFRRRMLPIAGRVTITVRWSKGRDIAAACGQLATRTGADEKRPAGGERDRRAAGASGGRPVSR